MSASLLEDNVASPETPGSKFYPPFVPTAALDAEAEKRLAQFPDSGRVVPEFQDPELREVLWRNYRVVYRNSRGRVEVVIVFHGSRPFPVDG